MTYTEHERKIARLFPLGWLVRDCRGNVIPAGPDDVHAHAVRAVPPIECTRAEAAAVARLLGEYQL